MEFAQPNGPVELAYVSQILIDPLLVPKTISTIGKALVVRVTGLVLKPMSFLLLLFVRIGSVVCLFVFPPTGRRATILGYMVTFSRDAFESVRGISAAFDSEVVHPVIAKIVGIADWQVWWARAHSATASNPTHGGI